MAENISPKQAHDLLSSGEAILIDVREPDEFAENHIAYAASVPLSSLDSIFQNMHIPESRKIIFQCFKGARGEKACVLMKGKGQCLNEVYNIEGGISAWEQAGLPVIAKAKKAAISIFRQVQIIVGGLIALLIIIGLTGISLAFIIAGLLAAALFTAGITGWCGLALLLSKMPWNKTA